MSGSDRRVFATIVGILVCAALACFALYPQQPYLTGNAGYQEQERTYYPGGSDCQPAVARGPVDRKSAKKPIACKEAAEQHRLQADDLIQQRRAADAADASVIFSYEQTRLAAFGAALGIVTMAAAIAAAFYAKRAAEETQRGADFAEEGLSHARQIADADLRPYLFIDRLEVKDAQRVPLDDAEGGGTYFVAAITIYLKNFGKVPARNISIFDKTYLARLHRGKFWKLRTTKVSIGVCAPNHERRIFAGIYIAPDEYPDFSDGLIAFILRIRFSYEDDNGTIYTEKAAYQASGDDVSMFYLLHDIDIAEARQSWKQYEMEYKED